MPKTYFLAPTLDSPPEGAIALGNIIKSPRKPEMALNRRDSKARLLLVDKATRIEEDFATRSVTRCNGLAAGVWASFLEATGLGAGGGVSMQLQHSKAASYEMQKLTTITIDPTIDDIREIFADVRDSLRNSRFNHNLYMITGVQIASGTDYMITAAKSKGQYLHVSGDLTPLGAPVTVGAGVQAAQDLGILQAGHIRQDIVFSYRLREILYKRKIVNEQRDFRKGDLYAKNPDVDETLATVPQEHELKYEAKLLDLQEEDPELPGLWDLEAKTALDTDGTKVRDQEGDEVVCVYVTGEDEEEEEEEEDDEE